jgi:hypothetical protein
VSTVRPPLWPQAASAPVNRGGAQPAGQSAVQKAFFDAALGRAGGQASPPQQTQATAPVAPIQNRTPTYGTAARQPVQAPQPAADGEIKYRRPGSILDIRV